MKRDARRSQFFNPRRAVGIYNEKMAQALCAWYDFNVGGGESVTINNFAFDLEIDQTGSAASYQSLANPTSGIYAPFKPVWSSPYVGKSTVRSAFLPGENYSNFKIAYNKWLPNPSPANHSTSVVFQRDKRTYSFWIALPDLNQTIPDTEICIATKVKAASTFASQGEWKLTYNTTTDSLSWVENALNGSSAVVSRTTNSRAFNKGADGATTGLPKDSSGNYGGDISGGEWFNVVLVVGDLIGATSKIYINGMDATASATAFVSPVNFRNVDGDILLGSGPDAVTTATSNDAQFNSIYINSFFAWNINLGIGQIRFLYDNYKFFIGTGNVSRNPRNAIRDFDNLGGAYPQIKRSSDQHRLGNKTPFFDDQLTYNYDHQSQILGGVMLDINSKFVSSSVASPNEPSTIIMESSHAYYKWGFLGDGTGKITVSELNNLSIFLTDSNGKGIEFYSDTAISNNPSRSSGNLYIVALGHLSAESTPAQVAAPWAKAVAFANTNGDIAITSTHVTDSNGNPTGDILWTQQYPGLSGNTPVTGSLITVSTASMAPAGTDAPWIPYNPAGIAVPLSNFGLVSGSTHFFNGRGSNEIKVRKGTSDSFYPFQYESIFNSGEDVYEPFKDTKTTSFTRRGFDSIPGFNSPMQDKDSFQVDITSTNDGPKATRWSKKWDWAAKAADPGASVFEFGGKDKTGFQYYSWRDNTWTEIGLCGNDVAFLSGSRPCHHDISVAGADVPRPSRDHEQVGEGGVKRIRQFYPLDKQYIRSGSDYMLRQFAPPFFPCVLDPETYTDAEISSSLRQIKNMGVPTISHFGPQSTKYFAREHNRIQLRDYINSPFLVEEIHVHLPVKIRRIYREFAKDFSLSPMDLYTFFIYRQETLGGPTQHYTGALGTNLAMSGANWNSQQTKDLMQVDYSNRYIVASASIIAYSDYWRQSNVGAKTDGWRSGFGDVLKTFTSPAAMIDLNTKISSSADFLGNNQTYTVEKTLDLVFRPGVTGEIFSTHTPVTSSTAMDDTAGKNRYPGPPPRTATSAISVAQRSYMTMSNQGSLVPPWWNATGIKDRFDTPVPDDNPPDERWAIINHYWPGGTTTAPLSGAWEGARPIPDAIELNFIGYEGGRYAGLPVWNKSNTDPDTSGGFMQWEMAARGWRCGVGSGSYSTTRAAPADGGNLITWSAGMDTQSPFPGDNVYASSSALYSIDGGAGAIGAGARYNDYLWGTTVDNAGGKFVTEDDSQTDSDFSPALPGVQNALSSTDGTRSIQGKPSKWVLHGRSRPMFTNFQKLVPLNNAYSGAYSFYIPASSSAGAPASGAFPTKGGNIGMTSQMFNPKMLDPRATLGSFGTPRAGSLFLSGNEKSIDRSYILANDENVKTSTETSYLLMPEDELIFGIDAAPGVPFTFFQDTSVKKLGPSSITGSYLQVTKGEATITFYGSYVKDRKQKYPSYSQNLTTATVHEVISNGEILDEWLINPDRNYLGSNLSEFVTGSMENDRRVTRSLLKGNLSDVSTVRTTTRYVDDKEMIYDSMLPSLSGAWAADMPWAGDTGIYAQCEYVRNNKTTGFVKTDTLNFLMLGSYGGTLGMATGEWPYGTNSSLGYLSNVWGITEQGEIKNESIPGNAYSYENSGTGINADPIDFGDTVEYSWEWGNSATISTEAYYANLANQVWPMSFPYEPRYSPTMRTLSTNLRDLVIGRPITANGYLDTPGIETGSVYGGAYYNLRNPYANDGRTPVSSRRITSATSPALMPSCSEGVYGGGIQRMVQVASVRGDKLSQFYTPNDTYRSTALALFGVGEIGAGRRGSDRLLTLNTITTDEAQSNSIFNKPHGFKYGLYNAMPQRTSAVFRSDRYGQFSDMLQQREFTRYADLEREILTQDVPVRCEFVRPLFETDGRMSVIAPQSTQSSNLSRLATSSLPYFEDTVRNRGPVATEAASVTVTVS